MMSILIREEPVRVSREQSEQNREQIIETAGRLFREHGIDGIGVADLMKQAGLTHGGFYGHFKSKEDLADQACARVMARSEAKWSSLGETHGPDAFAEILRYYLSPRHRDAPGRGCAIAALAADATRQQGRMRRTFERGIRRLAEIMETYLPGRAEVRRRKSLANLSTLVGALILARSVEDRNFSDEILVAAAEVLKETN